LGYDLTVRRMIQHRRLQWGQIDGNLRMDAQARGRSRLNSIATPNSV
jgi:hypothetical protein